MTDLIRNDLPVATIAQLAMDAVRKAGCEVYSQDVPWFNVRADRGWCAAEIARSFIRSTFAKGEPLRRKFLTALTKLGARPITA